MSAHSTGPILCAALLTALLLGQSLPVAAATRYVSDELIINFRALPSNQGRIIELLPSGTRLEVLEQQQEGEFSRVRTSKGTEGWVLTQYLVDQPVAATRLETANREVARLSRSVTELQQRLETVLAERGEAQQSESTLTGQVSQLEQELAEIKRVSSSALEMAAENRRLNDLNARLRNELDQLVDERDQLAANSQQRWLMIGGGLVLGGLLLGMILKSRPRRSAWS
jgi:SH3 domain protein